MTTINGWEAIAFMEIKEEVLSAFCKIYWATNQPEVGKLAGEMIEKIKNLPQSSKVEIGRADGPD